MKLFYDKEREVFRITESTRIEYNQTKHHLTRHIKNWVFDPRVKMRVWDGKVSKFDKGEFALGLWKEVYQLCQENGWKFEVENKKDVPLNRSITRDDVQSFCDEFFKDRKTKDGKIFFPYDHQIDSVFKILKNRYCLAEVATGGGKSLIFAITAFYILKNIDPDAKFLLIVPNISLVTQFYNDIVEYNLGKFGENKDPLDIKMTEIMSEKPRVDEGVCNIFIGTYQSLEKRPKKWFSQFHTVVSDEAHKSGIGNKSFGMKQVEKVLKNTFTFADYRVGMSGTFPEETTLDWIAIQSLHGPRITEVEAKTLMKKGVISPVKIKSIILNHNNPDFASKLQSIAKGGNKKAVYELERNYIHESQERMDFITEKIMNRFDKNALVLFNIKDYGKSIYRRLVEEGKADVYYIDGDTKKNDRETIKKIIDSEGRMEKLNKILGRTDLKDKPKILVASFGTFSTGVSLNNIHYLVMMESYKSEQIIIQSIGRALRLHKDKDYAIVFDITDIIDKTFRTKNILYTQYLKRREFYQKREYPYEEKKINI